MKLMFKKFLLASFVASFILLVLVPVVFAQEENVPVPENTSDIWDVVTKPFTRLFDPVPELFFVLILGVMIVGVWIKTADVGAVTAITAVMSLLLGALVTGPFSWIFRIIAGGAFVFLLYRIFKSR